MKQKDHIMRVNTMKADASAIVERHKLLADYDIANLSAHRAFMQGQLGQASAYYQRAFIISTRILSSSPPSEGSFQLSVHACLNCFDFCPTPTDSDDYHYLAMTGRTLHHIVRQQRDRKLRAAALGAYAEIYRLSQRLMLHDHSQKTASVVAQFTTCWALYGSSLIQLH